LNLSDGFTIEDGPSREQLFDALRLFDEHKAVRFELRSGAAGRWIFLAHILGIEAEDGSGHSWGLRARLEAPNTHQLFSNPLQHLYYHDGKRKGTVLGHNLPSEKDAVLKKPEVWLEKLYPGYAILDPDGWRFGPKSFDEPVTKEEFVERFLKCALQFPSDM